MYCMQGLKLPLVRHPCQVNPFLLDVCGTTRPLATWTTQIVKTCISSSLIVDMSVLRISFLWEENVQERKVFMMLIC